jgi:hypothetical protein
MNNSQITYKELQEEGLITKMEARVAEFIKVHGPCNGNDIDEHISGGHKRLANLERKGLIEAVADVRDIRTKRMTTIYRYVMNPKVEPIVNTKIKEPKKLNIDLNKFYDAAFAQGVIMTIDRIFPGEDFLFKDKIVEQILEVQK